MEKSAVKESKSSSEVDVEKLFHTRRYAGCIQEWSLIRMFPPQVTQAPMGLAADILHTIWPLSDVPEDMYELPSHAVPSHLSSGSSEEVGNRRNSEELLVA